jgi:hypothetical protein
MEKSPRAAKVLEECPEGKLNVELSAHSE